MTAGVVRNPERGDDPFPLPPAPVIGLDGKPIEFIATDLFIKSAWEMAHEITLKGVDPNNGEVGSFLALMTNCAADGKRLAEIARAQQVRIRTLESSLQSTMTLVPDSAKGARDAGIPIGPPGLQVIPPLETRISPVDASDDSESPRPDSRHPEEHGSGLACEDCGVLYASPSWVEAVIPNELWNKISPRGNGGGILCINCIAARCVARGLSGVPVMLTAGPLSQIPCRGRLDGGRVPRRRADTGPRTTSCSTPPIDFSASPPALSREDVDYLRASLVSDANDRDREIMITLLDRRDDHWQPCGAVETQVAQTLLEFGLIRPVIGPPTLAIHERASPWFEIWSASWLRGASR